MLATFEQLCAYYANGFLVDRVELGLDLTMSKASTHTHTLTHIENKNTPAQLMIMACA